MRRLQLTQPPPFGTIHPDDDRDIQIQRPRDVARKHLWQESRLLVRDLIFALMVLRSIGSLKYTTTRRASAMPELGAGMKRETFGGVASGTRLITISALEV